MSPGGKVVVYSLLLLWSAFVLFPLYWVVITSLKLPIDVNAGPVYLPWLDFEPNLHAWRDLLVTGLGDTLRPYLNSIIVGFLATALCMLIGSMAAYALARIEYRPKFGTIALFVAAMLAMAIGGRRVGRRLADLGGGRRGDLRAAGARARAPLQAPGRQWRHPVLDDLAAHPAAGRDGHPDLHDVPERAPARHPHRPDPLLHGGQPADRGLADARLLHGHPDRPRGERAAGRRLAPHRSSSTSCCRWPGPASPPPRSWC